MSHPWPTGILIPSARRLVTELTEAAQTPSDLPAQMVLGIAAGLCSRGIEVEWQVGRNEPTNLYLLTALAPSERKSTVVKDLLAPVLELEIELRKDAAKTIARWHEQKKLLEEQLKLTRTKVAKGKATEGDLNVLADRLHQHAQAEPHDPRLIVDDATQEALNSILRHQAVSMVSAEGNFIDGIAGRYSANGAPVFATLLKAWSGDSIINDRVGRGNETIERPILNISVTAQPASLVKLAGIEGARASGLLSRFLFSMPASRIGERRIGTAGVSDEAKAGWRATVRRLAALNSCVLKLSDDARKILYAFAEKIEARMKPGGDLRRIADWAGKVEIGQAVRIAGVLHCMEHAEPSASPISAETIQRALALTTYFIAQAKSAFKNMASPYAAAAVRVGKWIRQEGLKEVTPRLVYKKFGGKVAEATAILEELESEGKLARKDARTFAVEDLGEEEPATEPIPEFAEPGEPPSSVVSTQPSAVPVQETSEPTQTVQLPSDNPVSVDDPDDVLYLFPPTADRLRGPGRNGDHAPTRAKDEEEFML